MRLINVHTHTLESFNPGEIPEYAILSHTWGEDEVLYQDLEKPASREKSSWKKIEFCCKEAISRNINYVWIDTCSIDKSSSAELSESINSMYSWYQRSEICFAYLEDVDSDISALDQKFRRSRWFTRGWTLQELLSPTVVEFFSNSWASLGTKDQLADIISEVTQIDTTILRGKVLVLDTSVAKRMSWVSTRQTTRPEDIAYCLMGLFEVHMPLLYGEGNRAFLRLQEEIIRSSDDQSIFAWKFEGKFQELGLDMTVFSSILAPSPFFFKGCGNIIPFFNTILSSSYNMTNKGLEIELPLIIKPPNENNWIEKRAVLHCRYDDDRAEPLTIRVRGQIQGNKYFQVQRIQPPIPVPLSEVVGAEKRKIIIVHPRQDRGLSFYHDTTHVFLIQNNLPKSFRLTHVKSPLKHIPDNVFVYDSNGQGPCSIALGYKYESGHLLALRILAPQYFSTLSQIFLYIEVLKPSTSFEHWVSTLRDIPIERELESERSVLLTTQWADTYYITVNMSLEDRGSMGIWLVQIDV
jgi:hypothetical protein